MEISELLATDKLNYLIIHVTWSLNDKWLNDVCFYPKIFPNSHTTVRSDTVSSTKCSAAVPTAVTSAVVNFNGMIYSFMTNGLGRNFQPKLMQLTY
jgi:hypothetical protein